jgi:hypothetical protein
MAGLLVEADRILRGEGWEAATDGMAAIGLRFVTATLAAGMLYGAVMGTYGGLGADRLLQMLYSALKLPLLLLLSFAVSLPSFFVLNTLLGVRSDFTEVLRALLGSQAALTLVLASMAPLTALWYLSFTDYQPALLFNAALFATASFAAQWRLRSHYRTLVRRNPRHGVLLLAWLVLYAFVGIQMGWILRPFVGAPWLPVEFFRDESWGNAYVVVARMVWRLLTG